MARAIESGSAGHQGQASPIVHLDMDSRHSSLLGPLVASDLPGSHPGASPRWPAWGLSATLHAFLVLMLGLLLDSPPPHAPSQPDRRAGIALVSRHRSQPILESEPPLPDAASPADSAAAQGAAVVLPGSESLAVEPAFSLPESTQAVRSAASLNGLPSARGLAIGGQPSNRLSGGGVRTQVFGTQGLGSKFVYVFDRSASMEGFRGRPMEAARTELVNSLRDLASVHQFQIVFYNERATVFRPFPEQPPRMMFGTDENKLLAEQYVRSVTPAGATRHLRALELGLGMRPDVMFFLTDAAEPQLTASELERIRRRNGGVTAIHTIEFGLGPKAVSENFLVRLARQNNGQYVYVDVTQLPLASAEN